MRNNLNNLRHKVFIGRYLVVPGLDELSQYYGQESIELEIHVIPAG